MKWPTLLLALLLAASSAATAQTESGAQGEPPAAQGITEERKADARVTDLRLSFDGQRILLSFKLLGAFDENLRKRVDSGLPTSLTFDLELVRSRKSWFDKAVDSGTLQVLAMYNAVTREYLINFKHDGDLIESRVVKDATELERAMTEFTDFMVFSTEGKNPRQRLRVRVRAELRTKTVFFFIPSTVHTDWAETRKFRLSEEIE
ncbi:MAG: DUF4390 domain-containing protein [bacterium]|nr:DUF4390 domain-containing protein [bacterium]